MKARARRHRGGTLVEMLCALAITSAMLTAVGSAYVACAAAIEQNEQLFRAVQSGRLGLNYVLGQIRRADAVNVVSADRVDVIAADGAEVSFQFDKDKHQLKLVTLDDPDDADYILARNIPTLAFSADEEPDPSGLVRVVRVSMELGITVKKNAITLSGSAAPRRARTLQS